MATTHKTHIVRTLACGCQETRWVFGKEITKPQSGVSRAWHVRSAASAPVVGLHLPRKAS